MIYNNNAVRHSKRILFDNEANGYYPIQKVTDGFLGVANTSAPSSVSSGTSGTITTDGIAFFGGRTMAWANDPTIGAYKHYPNIECAAYTQDAFDMTNVNKLHFKMQVKQTYGIAESTVKYWKVGISRVLDSGIYFHATHPSYYLDHDDVEEFDVPSNYTLDVSQAEGEYNICVYIPYSAKDMDLPSSIPNCEILISKIWLE